MKTLKITYFITKWILRLVLFLFFLILEKFFLGLSSYSNNIARGFDFIISLSGIILFLFSLIYFPMLYVFLLIFRYKNKNVYPDIKLLIKKNTKISIVNIFISLAILGITLYLLNEKNTLIVKNVSSRTIEKIKVIGENRNMHPDSFNLTLKPNESKKFNFKYHRYGWIEETSVFCEYNSKVNFPEIG